MPSMTAVRVKPALRLFSNRLKPSKAKPIVALVAVQRKLLLLMDSLYKKNAYYDAKFEIKKTARAEALAAQDRGNLNDRPLPKFLGINLTFDTVPIMRRSYFIGVVGRCNFVSTSNL